jgi:hypothetical protein
MSWYQSFIKRIHPGYVRLVSSARSQYLSNRITLAQIVRNTYGQYADAVEREIRRLGTHGLKAVQLQQLEKSLRIEQMKLAEGLTANFQSTLEGIVELGTNPSKHVLIDNAKGVFKQADIEAFFVKVNADAVNYYLMATESRGLSLSEALWGISEEANKAIMGIIRDSVATGADAFKTASLLGNYIQGSGTAQRALIRQLKDGGIKKYYVPKDVKYEALRLVRTETSKAFAGGVYKGGQANPFYLGINWVLSASHDITDICDDYAAQGFFPAGEEPDIPHPQCMCSQVPVYSSPEEASDDLQEWQSDPSSHPDIEDWYRDTYLPALGGYRS